MTMNNGSSEHLSPIAIIGLGCRLAGDVTTPEAFWDFLLDGRSAVREVPAERWEPYLRRDPRNAAVLRTPRRSARSSTTSRVSTRSSSGSRLARPN